MAKIKKPKRIQTGGIKLRGVQTHKDKKHPTAKILRQHFKKMI